MQIGYLFEMCSFLTDRRLFWWMFAPQMSTRAQMPQGFQGTGLQFTTPRKGTETILVRHLIPLSPGLQFTTPRKGTETCSLFFIGIIRCNYNSLLPVRGRKPFLIPCYSAPGADYNSLLPVRGRKQCTALYSYNSIEYHYNSLLPVRGRKPFEHFVGTNLSHRLQFTTPRKGTETVKLPV